MLRIYIARHGQDEDNANGILNGRRDTPLTAIGVKQASNLADAIRDAGLRFDIVYCSPLKRARMTANIIATRLRLRWPTAIWLLIERNFGVMTGKSMKDIHQLCGPNVVKTDTITYFLSPEGAETFPQLMDRARLFLKELCSVQPDGNVLLVTHGDIGKMIFAVYYGLDWQTVLTMFHFGNSELLILSEDWKPEDACVVKIEQFNH